MDTIYKASFAAKVISSFYDNKLEKELKINTLVFSPTKESPLWKLCTIGASDYLMPKREIGFGRFANRRNEYIMFISTETRINENSKKLFILNALLWSTAKYPYNEKSNITVTDTIEINLVKEYARVVILLPELLNNASSTKCYVSKNKFISIFQVMPISKKMLDEKLNRGKEGVYWLIEKFYTHDDNYKIISSNALIKL